jgi:hypothetical protein
MVSKILKYFICFFNKHVFIDIGKCPFTNNEYQICTRCERTVIKSDR